MDDRDLGSLGNMGMCPIGDAQAGCFEQWEIVGTVTDGDGVFGTNPARGRELQERFELRVRALDRLQHPPGEATVHRFQPIGHRQVEADRIRRLGDDAIEQMKERGLTVVPVDQQSWRREVEAAYPKLRGRLAPIDLFDEAIRLRDEYRAQR